MTGYVCDRCPLAFELGHYHDWDRPGGVCLYLMCGDCGTMHKVEHPTGRPATLFGQPGPIPEMAEYQVDDSARMIYLPVGEGTWRHLGEVVPPPAVDDGVQRTPRFRDWSSRLKCCACNRAGSLISGLPVTDEPGGYREHCPMCGGAVEIAYVSVIN